MQVHLCNFHFTTNSMSCDNNLYATLYTPLLRTVNSMVVDLWWSTESAKGLFIGNHGFTELFLDNTLIVAYLNFT